MATYVPPGYTDVGSWIIEVIVACVIVVLLYLLSNWAAAADQRTIKVVVSPNDFGTSIRTNIVDGYVGGSLLRNKVFDTVYASRPNYIFLGGDGQGSASGGSDFSYSFWAIVKDVNALMKSVPVIVLLKGDSKLYSTYSPSLNGNLTASNGITIKSPLIQLQSNSSGTGFDIVFACNMMNQIDASLLISGNPADDPTLRNNVMSLTVGRWSLWTFNVSTYSDDSGRRVGTVLQYFINDVLITSKAFPDDVPRPNYGDLMLFPPVVTQGGPQYPSDAALSAIMVSDIVFTSPAMTATDMQARVAKGVSSKPAAIVTQTTTNVLNLSVENVLNFANT